MRRRRKIISSTFSIASPMCWRRSSCCSTALTACHLYPELDMRHPVSHPLGVTAPLYADRIGFARLTHQAFVGVDLRPLRDQLVSKIADGTAQAGEGLDLSLIAQLL